MFVSNLPPELIVQLFLHVDMVSLMRCRRVCRVFSNAIATEPALQYHFQLFYAGMINNDNARHDLSVLHRLQTLRSFRQKQSSISRYWLEGSTHIHVMKYPNSMGRRPYHGGIFAYYHQDRRTVGCINLLNATEAKGGQGDADQNGKKSDGEWEYVINRLGPDELIGHFMDTHQDLLILAEGFSVATARDDPRLQFLSLRTGKPHPLASFPELDFGQGWVYGVSNYHIAIYEELIAIWVSFNDTAMVTTEVTTQIEVYNWKTTERIIVLNEGGDLGCTLLSSTHLLVFSVEESKEELSLRIHNLYGHPFDSSSEVIRIRFPRAKTMDVKELIVSFSNGFTNLCCTPPNLPFHSDPTHSIIILSLRYSSIARYLHFFERSALLSLLKLNPIVNGDRITIEWDEYAKISSTIPVGPKVLFYACGARVVLGSTWERKIWIFDWLGWFAKKRKEGRDGLGVVSSRPKFGIPTIPVSTIFRYTFKHVWAEPRIPTTEMPVLVQEVDMGKNVGTVNTVFLEDDVVGIVSVGQHLRFYKIDLTI